MTTPLTTSINSINAAAEALLPIDSSRGDSTFRSRHLSVATASTPGFFGSTPRLLAYNPLKVPYLEMTLPGAHRGWQTDFWLWFQSLSCCVATLAIGFFMPTQIHMASLEQTVENTASAIATLVAFLVGGFVMEIVAVWKERRTNYASLVGAMRSLLVSLSSCVSLPQPGCPPPPATTSASGRAPAGDEELILASRATLGRHVLLACELAVLKPRGHIDTPRGRAHLERLDLLREGEWEAMVASDRHTSVFCWIQASCVDLRRRGVIDGHELGIISNAVTQARAQANDLMSSLSRDLPMPYTNLVAWLVRLAVLLQTVVHGLQVRALDDTASKVWAAAGIFLYAFFFFSFLGMHRVLHNPFLERLIDVAHEPIVNEGLKSLADGLMRGHAFLPPTWPAPSSAAAAASAAAEAASAHGYR